MSMEIGLEGCAKETQQRSINQKKYYKISTLKIDFNLRYQKIALTFL